MPWTQQNRLVSDSLKQGLLSCGAGNRRYLRVSSAWCCNSRSAPRNRLIRPPKRPQSPITSRSRARSVCRSVGHETQCTESGSSCTAWRWIAGGILRTRLSCCTCGRRIWSRQSSREYRESDGYFACFAGWCSSYPPDSICIAASSQSVRIGKP